MMVVFVELEVFPVVHPGEAAGPRIPVRPNPIPGRLILALEGTPVGVADAAVEGKGEACDHDPQDGGPHRHGDEHDAGRPGRRRLEKYAEDDAEGEAWKDGTKDERAFPAGYFFLLCFLARGGHCGAFGNLFHENLRA